MEIKGTVREFIMENFLFGQEDLDDDASIFDTGILDSTGILELVGFLEETFKISVEDDELLPENLNTVHNVVAYVEKKRQHDRQLLSMSRRSFGGNAVIDFTG